MVALVSNFGWTRRQFLYSAAIAFCAPWARSQSGKLTQPRLEALSEFGNDSRRVLLSVLNDEGFRGKIPAAVVDQLLRLEKKAPDELMLDLLPLARSSAHPPLSNFFVGAVVRGGSGNLYIGGNIEFPGQALGFTVHAEQASLANAYMSGETAVETIAVTAAPCGHCRQFLYEMSPTGEIRVLLKNVAATNLAALLPMAFGPKDLGFSHGALPISNTTLSLLKPSTDDLTLAALDAARKSYSPYTLSHSGIALRMSDQRMIVGSYIENAAYNPSLSPLEGALAGVFASGRDSGGIGRAVLVETASPKISQESFTRVALSSLAPTAHIEVVKCAG